MKSGVEHVVPLPPRAVEILRELRGKPNRSHVFTNGDGKASQHGDVGAHEKHGRGRDAARHEIGLQYVGKELTNYRAGNSQRRSCPHGGEARAGIHPRQKPAHVREAREAMQLWCDFLSVPAAVGDNVTALRSA